MEKRIAVGCGSLSRVGEAKALADALRLPFIVKISEELKAAYDYFLYFTDDYLALIDTKDKKERPFYIDFVTGKMRYRAKIANLKTESLARAIGKKPNKHPVIVDATAGLGRDSFILASLGYEVTLLERSPIFYALLHDALQRGKKSPDIQEAITRLHLIHTDAIDWLHALNSNARPNVIYLDPMFAPRIKSALVKKEMVLMQTLLPKRPTDDVELFTMAITCATERVVVKRARLAANIAGQNPSFSLLGKSSRFDIYLV